MFEILTLSSEIVENALPTLIIGSKKQSKCLFLDSSVVNPGLVILRKINATTVDLVFNF